MLQFLNRRWVYHTLIWVAGAILTSEIAINPENLSASLWKITFETMVYFTPIVICVYVILFLKERYLIRQRYWSFAMLMAFTIALCLGLYQFEYHLFGMDANYLRQDAQNLFFISLIAISLQHFKRDILDQYRLKELQARNTEIELAALKTQLNPHFLFNSLNNIYGVVQEDTPKGSEMIIGLADVMRYYLRSSSRESINLEEEAQLIQSYIELEALRLNSNCILTSDIQLTDVNGEIAPLLLLPFIENAFKHGTHPVRPCFISISLKAIGERIIFSIENSVVNNSKVIKTNIGLTNTKKRLSLIYPKQHELDISENQTTYSVRLIIPLRS